MTTVLLASGTRSLHAYYAGDVTYAPSNSAPVPQTVQLGDSLGFRRPVSSLGTQVAGLATGDFNGDGKQDFVMANVASTITVYLGNGNGTFQTGVPYATPAAPQSLAVGDFNGDGRADHDGNYQRSPNIA